MIESSPMRTTVGERSQHRFAAVPERTASTVIKSADFKQLTRAKARLVGPLLGVSLAFILILALLAGYDHPFMSTKVVRSFNIGYVLVLLTYVLCLAVSVIYVRVANRKFEAAAARVAASERAERVQ